MNSAATVLPAQCDVAVIGSGPAGLALATELKKLGVANVLVLERESVAGGVPRHCGHYPFGVVEYKRLLKGPDYARRLVANARASGCAIHLNSTVTQLGEGGVLSVCTPAGKTQLLAKRVALCTGVRESSRAQRFIGGDRPLGVMSTGALQSMVYEQSLRPFKRPVILGTELVSFSSILTCRHAGITPVAMLEQGNRVTARRFTRGFTRLIGLPTEFGVRNLTVHGSERVEAVGFEDASGKQRTLDTDGVIVSGQFRPEAALLRISHIAVDQKSGGAVIDQYGRCSDPAYYSAGNALRAVETSAWCWREGVQLAARIARDLQHNVAGSTAAADASTDKAWVPVVCHHPALQYCVPQRIAMLTIPGAAKSLQLRVTQPVNGRLTVSSGGRQLWSGAISSRPERRILIPLKSMLPFADGMPVEVTIEEAR